MRAVERVPFDGEDAHTARVSCVRLYVSVFACVCVSVPMVCVCV